MSTNQGKRKRKTNWTTAKKYLRHFRNCGILNIKKDICANRCPTGATDRRLARLNDYDKNSRLTLAEQGGYFCVLLLSLPIEYPIPKQVKPKLSTAISPKISIGSALLSPDSLAGFYVIGGSQSLRRGLTAYHPGSSKEILPYFDKNFNLIFPRPAKIPATFVIKSRHWHF